MADPPELLDHTAHVGEPFEGVLEHVEVVVRVLLHAAQPIELGQDHRERAPDGEVAEGHRRSAGGQHRRTREIQPDEGDHSGAEQLLGRGDMLFLAPDASAPQRIQGVFVSDAEIQKLVAYWREQDRYVRDARVGSHWADLRPRPLSLGHPVRGVVEIGNGGPEPYVACVERILDGIRAGDLQKVVLARELSRDLTVLIAAQPTRGLDVGSIEFVHRRLIEVRDSGVAVLIVSTELDEVCALADRILVMYQGRVAGIVGRDSPRDDLGMLMAGVVPA